MLDMNKVALTNQIFEKLEGRILGGKYEKGKIVNERELAQDLNVGIVTVRDAIERLKYENLLEETADGYIVLGITDDEVIDLYIVRQKIEGLAAARAAERITDEQLAFLEELIKEQEASASKKDSGAMNNIDTRFHDTIYQASGSVTFQQLLHTAHYKLEKYRKASLDSGQSRRGASVNEHRAIYEALKAHDPKAAEHEMLVHLENVRKNIEKYLK